MIETKNYRELKQTVKELYSSTDKQNKKILKETYKELTKIHSENNFSEYSLYKEIKSMQHHFSGNIDCLIARCVAERVWKSIKKLLFSNGKIVHFKKYGDLESLEGKNNTMGIRFKHNTLIWNGLKIRVKIDYSNPYEYQAMQDEICYCRIKCKFVRGEYKYYLQLILKNTPPLRINKYGELKRDIGNGNVGLDIGTQSIAIVSNTDVKLLELSDRVNSIEKEKRKLLRYLDRSRRANNPDNFNENGTNKKQGTKKVTWIKSKKYIKAQNQLKELYRKQADVREYQHQQMSNHILSLGDVIKVETMNYKGLQSKVKKTTINEKTCKYNKKKRFGKSLGNKAPSKLLKLLDNKLKYFGKELKKVNTREVKASQYNHLNGEYNKKKLSQRWNDLIGVKVQRDLYSAFLIQHVNDDLKSINQEGCAKDFEKFIVLHNKEIERLNNMELNLALKNVM